jgi:hypothetical protein
MKASIETKIRQKLKKARHGEGRMTSPLSVEIIVRVGDAVFSDGGRPMRPEADVAEAQHTAAVLAWHYLEQLKTGVATASIVSAELEATLAACETEVVLDFMAQKICGTLLGLNQIGDAHSAMIGAVSEAFVAAQTDIRQRVVAACAFLNRAYPSLPPWLTETNRALTGFV